MKKKCNYNIVRVIDVFDKKSNSHKQELILNEIDFPLKKLKQLIGNYSNDYLLYNVYRINPNMKSFFENKLKYKFDFEKNIYELGCYQTQEDVNEVKGIRKCTK